jgi:hypothetical protein
MSGGIPIIYSIKYYYITLKTLNSKKKNSALLRININGFIRRKYQSGILEDFCFFDFQLNCFPAQ